MDTDFEDECKEIHRRRQETSDKLKKLDKDQGEREGQKVAKSPSKMQDIMAIVSTACEVSSNNLSSQEPRKYKSFFVCLVQI